MCQLRIGSIQLNLGIDQNRMIRYFQLHRCIAKCQGSLPDIVNRFSILSVPDIGISVTGIGSMRMLRRFASWSRLVLVVIVLSDRMQGGFGIFG